ncbi:MAG: hypothetical protein K0V04_25120 [Deltaproteobacteria bacterium]|nr:hypothetical protein [Deltaproteobacteria bacterium]
MKGREVLFSSVLLVGCGAPAGEGFVVPPGTTHAAEESSGTSAAEDTGPVRDPEEPKLDVAPPEVPGCRKIDFLFVIDDSDSMADEQQLLIDGFPGFIEGIRETIEAFDFHVMVVGTGAQDMSFDPCENRLGTGRVRSAQGEDCGLLTDFLNGQRYLDETHDDLEGAFSCIADVGSDGNGDEKIVWSLANALTEHDGADECNEGFLRDDALLVVTIITDEEDDPDDGPPTGDFDDNSPGDPASWTEGLTETVYGDAEAVVLLALLSDSDLDDGLCEPYEYPEGDGAEPAPRIREFVESFPDGSWASVCQPDYASFFNAAIADIDAACGGFQPPG